MAIVYQVFSNDGHGGPIDYTTPIATVAGTSYTTGPLAASGDYRFAVRAKDAATGLSEANTQASVRIALDAGGNDVGAAPGAPFALVARATSGGGCLAEWSYLGGKQAPAPASFLVYLTAGTSPALTIPVATAPYRPGVSGYSCRLGGLADAVTYTVAVVARGASPLLVSGPAVATVVGDATPPEDVESLAAVAVP